MQQDCSACGSQYDLEVLDLGHKESDHITCQVCGKIFKEWHNEARSYSIKRLLQRGERAKGQE